MTDTAPTSPAAPAVGSVPSSEARPSRRRARRILAFVFAAIAVLALVGAAAFLWWAQPQPLLPEAGAALSSTPGVAVEEAADGRLTFVPSDEQHPVGLVLYPGGKVPPAAYAPAARDIAEEGYLVTIVPVPFNLAILDTGAAAAAMDDHPEIARWAVGGHSLGGVAAAQFVDAQPERVDGLVLWASYSAADLSDDDVRVATVYGSLDTQAATFADPANIARLGTAVSETVIQGGNHEQMGWYTGQPDDPPATISRADQQAAVVEATLELLAGLRADAMGPD
jgi:hypothetical protein